MMQFRAKAMMFGPHIATPSPLLSGMQGVPYAYTLNGTGGTPSYTYALLSGSLDTGLSLSPAGLISGTPANAETDTLGLQITDANGLKSVPQSFTLTVVPVIPPLTALWPDPLPNGTVGTPYSFTLTASGGVPPYTYSLTAGTLPTGLSLNPATGAITGTPSVAISFDAVTFGVTDSSP